MTVKVKVCGLTNLPDARAALLSGADYLGFIFYPPSVRGVDVVSAAEIVANLRAEFTVSGKPLPAMVGVFVNETAARIAEVLDECQLDYAQLSGDELPPDCTDSSSALFGRAYKAIRPRTLDEAFDSASRYASPAPDSPSLPQLLVDTPHPTLPGGTGEQGDWSISRALAGQYERLMLAGGLGPHNVADAVRLVRPFAVDAASGLERAPGVKDHRKVAEYVRRAKLAGETPL